MLEKFILLVANYSFEIQVFAVIFATLLVAFLSTRFFKIFDQKVAKTDNVWDNALSFALQRPIKIIIYVLGFSYALEIIDNSTELAILDAVSSIRKIFIIFAIAIFGLRFLRKSEEIYINKHKANKEKLHTINAINKLLRISVIISSILILMQSLGISISGVVAFGGMGGVAIGFAAKDLLSNFFGALMIYLDKPFREGDWIRSPDQEIEGTVASIGWRQTKIITFSQRPIYVPNSVFSNISVENPSRMTHRRIYENIGVRYDDFSVVSKIVDEVKAYLRGSKEIAQDQTLIVNFNKYADSALEIMIYCFTREKEWVAFHEIKQNILLDIGDIILKHKAEMAYPTMSLDIVSAPK